MGDEACDGLRIGIKPRSVHANVGGQFHYQLAITHYSRAPRHLVLFSDMEPIYRTRLRFEAPGTEPAEIGLVVPQVQTLCGAQIAVDLKPDDVNLSEGWVTLPPQLRGEVDIFPVLGGTDAMPCKVLGKPLRLVIS
jgi:hypothetical protein